MQKYKSEKQYRKKSHDYSSNGYYFITITTNQRARYFCKIRDEKALYYPVGFRAKYELFDLLTKYNGYKIDKYVIMPDHIHLLINILPGNCDGGNDDNGMDTQNNGRNTPWRVPTGISPLQKISISSFINHFKGRITKWCKLNDIEFKWQRRFHDRIIRSEGELYNVRNYIDNNISRWNKF